MKKCPTCNRTFSDDTLSFCLEDGMLLSAAYDSEATIAIQQPLSAAETPTVVLPKQTLGERKFNLKYIVILILGMLLAAGSVVVFLYQKENDTPTLSQKVILSPYEITETASCKKIRDTRTGLEWNVGPDRDMTWYEAQQWTHNLNSCNGGWRMPSIREIEKLYDPTAKAGTGYSLDGKYYPAKIDPAFNAIGGGIWVWSNFVPESSEGGVAQVFNFNTGRIDNTNADNTANLSVRAFAVRVARN